jgi:hypothetical protein
MSPSTRSSRAERAAARARAVAGALLMAMFVAAPASANAPRAVPPLPPAVAALAPNLEAKGGGELTFFGFAVYDGWYWSTRPDWSLESPFALDLHYLRKLAGADIVDRTLAEIGKLGLGDAGQRARWDDALRRILPDVARNDRLTGLFLPPSTVRFFRNGVPIGEIVDAQFARAFFGVWLDPRTSRADFRQKLLGLP